MSILGSRKAAADAVESEDTKLDKALLESRTFWCYQRVRNRGLRTLEGDDYRKILEDPERWSSLVTQMDTYFHHSIDLFPYDNDGKSKSRVSRPERFFRIERDEIEKCFPGGRKAGEPGDTDLRDLLKGLQRSFTHNLARYYIIKRLGEALIAVGLASIFMMFRNGFQLLTVIRCFLEEKGGLCMAGDPPPMNLATLVSLILIIAAVAWIHHLINGNLHFCLESTLDTSSLFVDGQVAIRTKNLTNLVDDIVPRIDDDRLSLEKAGNEKDWPDRSKKWTILVYWLAKRLEYLERYAQIEIWQMRRSHFWLQLAGRFAHRVIFWGFVLAMLIIGYMVAKFGIPGQKVVSPLVYYGYAATMIAGIWTLRHSFVNWNTPLTLIADKLQPANWKRYSDVHLQEKLADQIVRDQRAILQKDTQLTG